MSYKDDLLERLDERHAEFKACLKGLTEEQMTLVSLGRWSVKDILAHISGWQREMVPALGRLARGERPTPEGTDYSNVHPWNDRFVERDRSRSLDEMLKELDEAFAAFREAAAAVPEERWEPGRTLDRMIHASGISHYREHRAEIEAWRRSL